MKNEKALRDLTKRLTDGRYLTVAQICAETGCSKPVAHNRLRSLAKLGAKFQTYSLREAARGPKSKAYALVPSPALKSLLT
jgi:hypothetical protein